MCDARTTLLPVDPARPLYSIVACTGHILFPTHAMHPHTAKELSVYISTICHPKTPKPHKFEILFLYKKYNIYFKIFVRIFDKK